MQKNYERNFKGFSFKTTYYSRRETYDGQYCSYFTLYLSRAYFSFIIYGRKLSSSHWRVNKCCETAKRWRKRVQIKLIWREKLWNSLRSLLRPLYPPRKKKKYHGGKPRKKKVSRIRLKLAGIYRRYILAPCPKPRDRRRVFAARENTGSFSSRPCR